MSTNSDHSTIEELIADAKIAERRRIIGVLLNAVGVYRLSGQFRLAEAIDALVTAIEHPDTEALNGEMGR